MPFNLFRRPSGPAAKPVPIAVPPSRSGRDDPLEALAAAGLIEWSARSRQAIFRPGFHRELLTRGPAAILEAARDVDGPAKAMLALLAARDRHVDPTLFSALFILYEKDPIFRERVGSGPFTQRDLEREIVNAARRAKAPPSA